VCGAAVHEARVSSCDPARFHQARDYYLIEGGPHLADQFEREFQACLAPIQAAPRRFPYYLGSKVFRRIRLRNFPYLIIYREKADAVRVTVLKHEKRDPVLR
jgi:plasmid stabilization system protein ParE